MAHRGDEPHAVGLCRTASFLPQNLHRPSRPSLASSSGVIAPAAESAAGTLFSSSGGFFGAEMRGDFANPSSSADEFDCGSGDILEALGDGMPPAKPIPARNPSKRSRAAEVHNLSEKRRRSRINEKMKALQNLIPNSNKTDKASMLDEAIEYLKQLQLQVQMLSMRNGLSLHPICLPEVELPHQLNEPRMGYGDGNESIHMNMRATLPLNQEGLVETVLSMPNQCTPANQPSFPNLANIINSESSFHLESSIHSHLGPFQGQTSPEENGREDMLSRQPQNVYYASTNSLEFKMGATPSSVSLDAGASDFKNDKSLEACILKRETGGLLSSQCNQSISSLLNGGKSTY